MKFKKFAWRVPSPERATEGWLEGRPTKEQLEAAYDAARRARSAWRPDEQAWQQLVDLHAFVGKHVRIQFWDPIMYMLEEEGPCPLIADCRGILTVHEDGFLQPYLLVENERDQTTPDGYSALKCLHTQSNVAMKLAPVAELLEVDEVDDAELERQERESAPRQNRVSPTGELIRTRARGTLMGNRGCLHNQHREIVNPASPYCKSTRDWKWCKIETDGPKRQIMKPDWYTELFFLDEATALSAGHRPCFQCTEDRFDKFVAAWKAGNPGKFDATRWAISVLDSVLHSERLDATQRKVTYTDCLDTLPDGTFVMWPPGKNVAPVLVLGDSLAVWTPGGYGYWSRQRPKGVDVSVLTPRSIVNALKAGYPLLDLPDATKFMKIAESDVAEMARIQTTLSVEEWIDRLFLRQYETWKG